MWCKVERMNNKQYHRKISNLSRKRFQDVLITIGDGILAKIQGVESRRTKEKGKTSDGMKS